MATLPDRHFRRPAVGLMIAVHGLLIGTKTGRMSVTGAGNVKEIAMRSHPMLSAAALLAAGLFAPAIGSAQSGPSADEIIKSLTPGSLRA